MMGRDYLWSMANPYYEFSITYIGRGFEYVDTIIAQWYNDGLINQPYPFHNDILKVFVEVGFPGFLLWSSIQYVLTPLFWQRYADQETTLLYLSELGYMTVTYLTDNTAFYFWSTMALRLVTLAYAMERKKPPDQGVDAGQSAGDAGPHPYSDEGSVTARSENNALYLVYSACL